MVLGVVVRLPLGPDRFSCLPILLRPSVNQKTAAKKRLRYRPPLRPWYRGKLRPSFADMPATLRHESVREQVSVLPLSDRSNRGQGDAADGWMVAAIRRSRVTG